MIFKTSQNISRTLHLKNSFNLNKNAYRLYAFFSLKYYYYFFLSTQNQVEPENSLTASFFSVFFTGAPQKRFWNSGPDSCRRFSWRSGFPSSQRFICTGSDMKCRKINAVRWISSWRFSERTVNQNFWNRHFRNRNSAAEPLSRTRLTLFLSQTPMERS